jgi:hypothetical protein
MLIARGYDVTDPVDRSGEEPEVVLTYRAVFDDVADEPP